MSRRKQFTLQELVLITLIAGVMAAFLIPAYFREPRARPLHIERAPDTRK